MEDFQEGTDIMSMLWDFQDLRGSDNYKPWSRKCRNALQFMGIYYTCIEEPPVKPSESAAVLQEDGSYKTKDQSVIYREQTEWATKIRVWKDHARLARGYVYSKLSRIPAGLVKDLSTAKEVWEALKTQYLGTGFTILYSTFQKLVTTSLGSCGNDLDIFIDTLRSLQRDFEELGHPLEEWIVVSHLLNNLDSRFEDFVFRTIMQKEPPTFEEVNANLQRFGAYLALVAR